MKPESSIHSCASLDHLFNLPETPAASRSVQHLVSDLDGVLAQLARRRQHARGLGADTCFVASALSEQLSMGNPRAAEQVPRLLAAARQLTNCLDKIAPGEVCLRQLKEGHARWTNPALFARLDRLDQAWASIKDEMQRASLDSRRSGPLSLQQVDTVCARAADIDARMTNVLAARHCLSFLVSASANPGNAALLERLAAYEEIVTQALQRAGSDPEKRHRVQAGIDSYDGLRPEIQLMDGQLDAIRTRLLGSLSPSASMTVRERPASAGPAAPLAALAPPSPDAPEANAEGDALGSFALGPLRER